MFTNSTKHTERRRRSVC